MMRLLRQAYGRDVTEIDADAWRSFRLVNGVYGQRQDEWMKSFASQPSHA